MSAAASEYLALITSEHRDKPRYAALISLYGQFFADTRNVLDSMTAAFDVATAVGQQLDYLAAWVGASRTITVEPSEAYPAASAYQFDLSDDQLRRLVQARGLANRWDGTPEMVVDILALFYGPSGTAAAILDNQDMSISLILAGTRPPAEEAAILAQMILPLKPAGVRIKDTSVAPTGGPLFGLDYANAFINGPDYGSFGETF